MKKQAYHMTMLYDFYGDLLTDRQKDFYDMYHNEDLSLAEIADEHNITRQGVRDVLMRAETSLEEIENKTGLIARYLSIYKGIDSLEVTIQQVETLNNTDLHNSKLRQLCNELNQIILSIRRD